MNDKFKVGYKTVDHVKAKIIFISTTESSGTGKYE